MHNTKYTLLTFSRNGNRTESASHFKLNLKYACLLSLLAFLFSLTSCRTHKHVGGNNSGGIHSTHVENPELKGEYTYKLPLKFAGKSIDKNRKKIIEESRKWIGTPYLYAGKQKGKGTDCSGLVMTVYEEVLGYKLPRNSAKQAEFCKSVDENKVMAGDLVFFATGKDPNRVSHVGILLDDGFSFIHASSKKGVCISRLDNLYYLSRFLKFGAVPEL